MPLRNLLTSIRFILKFLHKTIFKKGSAIVNERYTMCFFPWFTIKDPLIFKEFALTPWHRDAQHESDDRLKPFKEHITNISERYITQSQKPILSMTILILKGHNSFEPLDGDGIVQAFDFAELVTICGLASRKFFGGEYCNSSLFKLIIQNFQDPGSSLSNQARRKDGHMTIAYEKGLYKEICPPYVINDSCQIDVNLMESLLKVYSSGNEFFEDLHQSVITFNSANTDSNQISPVQEVVWSIGAFERLLEVRSGNEKEFISNITQQLTPNIPDTSPHRREAKRKQKQVPHILEWWARDGYILRGHHAHGRTKTAGHTDWSIDEHLLLAAYLFPLALKIKLHSKGFYQLTQNDILMTFSFSYFANLPNLFTPKDHNRLTSPCWVDARSQARWDFQCQFTE